MPLINFIGKESVVNHHRDVVFHTLKREYSFDREGKHKEDNKSENMIIHGDNLLALKALVPKYEGMIDVVICDPPYNSGNEGWIYNDNVKDPRISKWIGEVVGKEGEDLSRHDKWLCMMYPRLRMLSKLVKKDGIVVISIGVQEVNNLVALCEELFSTKNVVMVPVQTNGGKPNSGFNYQHEFLVFVTPKNFDPNRILRWGGNIRSPFEGLTLSTFNNETRPNQVYPIFINEEDMTLHSVGKSLKELEEEGEFERNRMDFIRDYESKPEGTVAIWPLTTKLKECIWRLYPERFVSDYQKGYIKITKNVKKNHPNKFSIQYLPDGVIRKIESGELKVLGTENPRPTVILSENQTEGSAIPTLWIDKAFYTVKGTAEINDIFFDSKQKFDYPKPLELIRTVIEAVTEEDDIILDSFAGSGTTGHAVLKQMAIDGLNRNFILIEMGDYADTITAERIKRAITGYTSIQDEKRVLLEKKLTLTNLRNFDKVLDQVQKLKEKHKGWSLSEKSENGSFKLIADIKNEHEVEGVDGDFSYYSLGEPLFTENDELNSNIAWELIKEYVWYTETNKMYYSHKYTNPYYLGLDEGIAYYLGYKPKDEITINAEFLRSIDVEAGRYVIFGDNCTLSEEFMKKHNITFKKNSRDIVRV